MKNITSKVNTQLIISSSYYYFTKARFFAGLFCRDSILLSDK